MPEPIHPMQDAANSANALAGHIFAALFAPIDGSPPAIAYALVDALSNEELCAFVDVAPRATAENQRRMLAVLLSRAADRLSLRTVVGVTAI